MPDGSLVSICANIRSTFTVLNVSPFHPDSPLSDHGHWLNIDPRIHELLLLVIDDRCRRQPLRVRKAQAWTDQNLSIRDAQILCSIKKSASNEYQTMVKAFGCHDTG